MNKIIVGMGEALWDCLPELPLTRDLRKNW